MSEDCVRNLCYRSNTRYHHWVNDGKLGRRTKTVIEWFFHCKLCQVVKQKLLTYKDLGNGKSQAVITEIFPSGQIMDEIELHRPLSNYEEHNVKS